MVYIKLFHGRDNPCLDMDNWGTDGPVFGPYEFIHTTYCSCVKLGKKNNECDTLMITGDMLYYNGIYYGDWSVFDEKMFLQEGFTSEGFEQIKAQLP